MYQKPIITLNNHLLATFDLPAIDKYPNIKLTLDAYPKESDILNRVYSGRYEQK